MKKKHLLSSMFSIATVTILLTIQFSQTALGAYDSSVSSLTNNGLLPQEMRSEANWDDIITTKEFYAMLVAFSQTPLSSEIELPYLDTNDTDWYAKYIQTALDRGIIRASQYNPKLNPDRQMKRRSLITKLFDTLGVGVDKFFKKSSFPFTDISDDGIFSPYAYRAHQLGILNTNISGAARPVSKAEVAFMLDKIYDFIENEGEVTVTIRNGTSYNSTEKTLINNKAFDVLLDIWSKVQKEYYFQEEIDESEMIYDAIDGIIESLEDPYTVFSKPHKSNSASRLNSEYEGVGMSVEMIDGAITIVSPFKNSPAEKAGLKPNDIITKIGNKNIEGMSLEEAIALIKGPSGSRVTLTIKRGSSTRTYTVTRAFVVYKTATVDFRQHNGKKLAVVDLLTFAEDSHKELLEVAKEINEATEVDGIILDLRNNPGGYLNVAIDIAQMFFNETEDIVILEKSNGSKTIYHSSKTGGEFADYEVVVLVNKGSASASEILAGALQDLNRAKIIGTDTFGKGIVQELSFYDDGSAFKLTVSKWLTPEGHDINKKGINPDKKVENTGSTDTQMESAKNEF